MLGTELGPQPPDVDIDGTGTAEEVVAPNLLQQLRAGEHPADMLDEEFQQFELLVGQVQRPTAQPRRVGALVDDQLTQTHLAGDILAAETTAATDEQSQPGVDLGGAGARQQDLVDPPVRADRDQPTLGDHRDHRHGGSGTAQQPAQPPCTGQVGPGVDDRHVRGARLQQRGHLGGRGAHGMRQQRQ